MKGSCACGAVEYEIDAIDMPIGHCHCHTCRKTHAAAFVSTAGVKREHFRWLKGQETLTAYESSPGKLRYFCSRCGSHLMAERPHLPVVIVRVATLDEVRACWPSITSGYPMMCHGCVMKAWSSIRSGSRDAD